MSALTPEMLADWRAKAETGNAGDLVDMMGCDDVMTRWPRVASIKWVDMAILRPPLTAVALRGCLCPSATTVTDESFRWGP